MAQLVMALAVDTDRKIMKYIKAPHTFFSILMPQIPIKYIYVPSLCVYACIYVYTYVYGIYTQRPF